MTWKDSRSLWLLAAAATFLLVCSVRYGRFQPFEETTSELVIPLRQDAGYSKSNSCARCHEGHYSSWHDSYHRTMTQEASLETVVGDFADVVVEAEGQTATLSKRGEEFWVNVVDPSWDKATFETWAAERGTDRPDPFSLEPNPPRIDAQVVMTTGSHHFQAYWLKGKDGRELWQFPWRYHIAEQRWVHRKDVFLSPPEWKPGMWSRVWNRQCIYCHTTGPFPGQDPATGVMEHTSIGELGIACEACHGPGEDHIAFHDDLSSSKSKDDDPIVNPMKLSNSKSGQVCGQCHSHFEHNDPNLAVDGPQYRPGKNLYHFGSLKTPPRQPEIMSRFWGDGTNRSGGREFNGMSNSQCYVQGEMSCTSCHSMHQSDPNDQLSDMGLTGEACLECHETLRDETALTQHTHHTATSTGSECYNCHMPHTNYALFKAIRSHTIDSPKVTSLKSNTRPNACNLCHLDKSLQWSAKHLEEWFAIPRPSLNDSDQNVAAGLLWVLKGDAGQRVIAIWHFGWAAARDASGTDWMTPAILETMRDPYAAVRWVAFDVLRKNESMAKARFDFDVDPTIRDAQVENLSTKWNESRTKLAQSSKATPELLLTPDGLPDFERMSDLLRNRDNRPVAVVE